MAFEIPTLDDSHEFGLALILALMDDPNISALSFYWLWSKTTAGAVTDNHAHIANAFNDLLPDTASAEVTPGNATSSLTRWGNITGKQQKGATPSSGNSALRVFGTVGQPVPDGSLLISAGQLTYQTVGTQNVTSTGYVDVNVLAVDTGTSTNLDVGTQLTFTATPTGIQDVAVIQIALTNGADLENVGAFRSRVLSQFSSPAAGGRADDYVQWALEQTGIANAYCYPIRQGLGSVDVAALHAGSGNERLLLAGEVAALQTTLDDLIPVDLSADAGSFRVLIVFGTTVNVEYTYISDGTSTSVPDWNDLTPPTVVSWTAGTRTLALSALPTDLAPGMRIIIATSGGDGSQFVVESLAGGNNIVLESAPATAPTGGDVVYAGGPLVDPARAAIQAMFDAIGPANPDSIRYGAWEGNVDPGAIDSAVRDVKGVLRGTVVTPSSLVAANDPAYPNDATIELLIAGQILVHPQH